MREQGFYEHGRNGFGARGRSAVDGVCRATTAGNLVAALAAGRTDPSQIRLLLPAVNDMADLTTMRFIASRAHLLGPIFAVMIVVALLSTLLAGYAMSKRKTRSWFHGPLYAGVIAIMFYTVLDLDYPRSGGFIQNDAADRALRQLRHSIR